MPRLDFWYEFASTYACLTAMRIEERAQHAGVQVRWRPFLLGPVFAAQGWNTSPFNLFPAKGGYMWRDMARHAEAMGMALQRPDPFPQNGLLAARVALIGHAEDWGPSFTRAVYLAEFSQGRQIADRTVIADILSGLGQPAEQILSRALAQENKARLRVETEEAMSLGIFGSPSFLTEDGELFWGNDRLNEALHWARFRSLEGFVGSV